VVILNVVVGYSLVLLDDIVMVMLKVEKEIDSNG